MNAAFLGHGPDGETLSPAPIPAAAPVTVRRWTAGEEEEASDLAAAETPVALEYNGISHAVMLASPRDLEDFALGFSLSEGIVAARDEVLDLEVEELAEGVRVAISIPARRFQALKQRRRSLAGRTGCGLCGTESLGHVFRDIAPVTSAVRIAPLALQRAFAAMEEAQPLQQATGATHAAGWMDADGRLVLVREDVGRHNALDKLIGAMAAAGMDFGNGAALITSRASSEMVQKAAALGIGVLAAISAPTGLAIRMAESLNLTLVGFARRNRHVLYAGAGRIAAGDLP